MYGYAMMLSLQCEVGRVLTGKLVGTRGIYPRVEWTCECPWTRGCLQVTREPAGERAADTGDPPSLTCADPGRVFGGGRPAGTDPDRAAG